MLGRRENRDALPSARGEDEKEKAWRGAAIFAERACTMRGMRADYGKGKETIPVQISEFCRP